MSACKNYEVEDLSFQKRFFATVDQSLIKHIKHEVQYDFWKEIEESEVEMLRKELAKVSASGHAVRRGTFALINEQRNMINEQKNVIEDLKNRLSIIERHICHL